MGPYFPGRNSRPGLAGRMDLRSSELGRVPGKNGIQTTGDLETTYGKQRADLSRQLRRLRNRHPFEKTVHDHAPEEAGRRRPPRLRHQPGLPARTEGRAGGAGYSRSGPAAGGNRYGPFPVCRGYGRDDPVRAAARDHRRAGSDRGKLARAGIYRRADRGSSDRGGASHHP